MCMMKNSGEKEACEVAKSLAALDGRVTKVEERMNKMEGSLNEGFTQVNVSTEYGDLVDGRIVRRYNEQTIVPPAPPVMRYSKLKLIVASKAAGKWEAFKAFIASAGYEDEWQACQFLSSGYEQFEQAKAAIIAAGIATAEEIDAILAASVDEEVGA